MRKLFFALIFVTLCIMSYAQTIIEKPQTGFSSAVSNLRIDKIELCDTTTVLYFHTTYKPNNWISIPKETFIRVVGSEEKLFVKWAKGIPLYEKFTMPASGEVDYQLIFPKVDKTAEAIDYGEAKGGGWNIYDIQLKPSPNQPLIPSELYGNWFNTKTGIWELSFFNKTVVYKSKVWKYENLDFKNGKGKILLNDKTKKVTLYVKMGKGNHLLVGETAKNLVTLSSDVPKFIANPADDQPYKLPVFKIDSATYSGYFKNYSPRIGISTIALHVNNILTGEQSSFVAKISEDGYFSAKVPLYYPGNIFVRSGFYNGSVFLEPGKETFQMIKSDVPLMFMGECAKINTDLGILQKSNKYDYEDIYSKVLDMTLSQYKAYYLEKLIKETDSLELYKKKYSIGEKAYQISKMEKKYYLLSKIMEFDWTFEHAYRKKNNISQSQRTIPVTPEKPTSEYYNFITNEIIDNPLAVLADSYGSFINRLKYLEILRNTNPISSTLLDIMKEIEKSGLPVTDEERAFFEAMKETESEESTVFQDKYGKQISLFMTKYMDQLKDTLQLRKSGLKYTDIEKILTEKGVKFTEEEKALLEACKTFQNSEASKKNIQVYEKYKNEIQQFSAKYQKYVTKYHTNKAKQIRNEKLLNVLGIQPGFASDIMNAQDDCRGIVVAVTPVSDSEIQIMKRQYSTPFIAEYIGLCNDWTLAKIEANKKKAGYTVNEVPKTEGDLLFDAIIQKYKGKVVYVDFWATWCGPCRSLMDQMKPLKEELSKENVVFVYITNQTSPENTWKNMIPDIKGEHFRVSSDEWNFLSKKFNISGIPHCVLVDKNGTVVNPHLGFMNNGALKNLIEKEINKE